MHRSQGELCINLNDNFHRIKSLLEKKCRPTSFYEDLLSKQDFKRLRLETTLHNLFTMPKNQSINLPLLIYFAIMTCIITFDKIGRILNSTKIIRNSKQKVDFEIQIQSRNWGLNSNSIEFDRNGKNVQFMSNLPENKFII